MRYSASALFFVCILNAVAFSQTRVAWPANGTTDVTTAPVVTLRFTMPVDSMSIVWQYKGVQHIGGDSTPYIQPTFVLTTSLIYASVPESLWYACAFAYTANKIDDSTITVTYHDVLHLGTAYEFSVDSLKIVDTTGGGRDTTGIAISSVSFTTEEPVPQLLRTSVLTKGGILHCNDTLSATYTHPLFTSSPTSGPIMDIIQQVVTPSDTDSVGTQLYTYDTVTSSATVWLSPDSMTVYSLLSSGFVAGAAYTMYVHSDRITGVQQDVGAEGFYIMNNFTVTVSSQGDIYGMVLPIGCNTVPDPGTYNASAGDTIAVSAIDTVNNYVFSHWQCGTDTVFNNDTASALHISYQCNNLKNDTLIAIYKLLNADTVTFDSLEHFTASIDAYHIDTVSSTKFIVSGPSEDSYTIAMTPDSGYLIDSIKLSPMPAGVERISNGVVQVPMPQSSGPDRNIIIYPIDPPNPTPCYSMCVTALMDMTTPSIPTTCFSPPPTLPTNMVTITVTPSGSSWCTTTNTSPFSATISVTVKAAYLPCWRISKILFGTTWTYYPDDSCTAAQTYPVSVSGMVTTCNETAIVYLAPAYYYLWTDAIIADATKFPYNNVGINVLFSCSGPQYKLMPINHYTNYNYPNSGQTDLIDVYQIACGASLTVQEFNTPDPPYTFVAWDNQTPLTGCGTSYNHTPSIMTTWNMTHNTDVQALFEAPFLLLAVGFNRNDGTGYITWYGVQQGDETYKKLLSGSPFNDGGFLANDGTVDDVLVNDNNYSIPNYNTLTPLAQSPVPTVPTTDVYYLFNKPVDLSTVPGNIYAQDVYGAGNQNNIYLVTGVQAFERAMDRQPLQSPYPAVLNYNVTNLSNSVINTSLTPDADRFGMGIVNQSGSTSVWNFQADDPTATPPIQADFVQSTPTGTIGAVKYETFQATVTKGVKSSTGDNLINPNANTYVFNAQTVYPGIDMFLFDYESSGYTIPSSNIYINALVGREDFQNGIYSNIVFNQIRIPDADTASNDNNPSNAPTWSLIGTMTHDINNAANHLYYTYVNSFDPDFGELIPGYNNSTYGEKPWSLYVPGSWLQSPPNYAGEWSSNNGANSANQTYAYSLTPHIYYQYGAPAGGNHANGGMMHFYSSPASTPLVQTTAITYGIDFIQTDYNYTTPLTWITPYMQYAEEELNAAQALATGSITGWTLGQYLDNIVTTDAKLKSNDPTLHPYSDQCIGYGEGNTLDSSPLFTMANNWGSNGSNTTPNGGGWWRNSNTAYFSTTSLSLGNPVMVTYTLLNALW